MFRGKALHFTDKFFQRFVLFAVFTIDFKKVSDRYFDRDLTAAVIDYAFYSFYSGN